MKLSNARNPSGGGTTFSERETKRTDNNSGKTGVPIWLLLEEVDLSRKHEKKTSSNSALFQIGGFPLVEMNYD
ncbi:hypothetical protein TNCV_970761 [Trichonephila clavipes]|nr:hypothetical protein TNCV_970761 [Trichonephila clavipes]